MVILLSTILNWYFIHYVHTGMCVYLKRDCCIKALSNVKLALLEGERGNNPNTNLFINANQNVLFYFFIAYKLFVLFFGNISISLTLFCFYHFFSLFHPVCLCVCAWLCTQVNGFLSVGRSKYTTSTLPSVYNNRVSSMYLLLYICYYIL